MITIGQQGKLGKEVLTVVSFNEKTFTCDNGKTYMIAFSKWMTEGKTVNVTANKKRKSTFVENGFYDDVDTAGDINEIMMESTKRQRGSSMR